MGLFISHTFPHSSYLSLPFFAGYVLIANVKPGNARIAVAKAT